MNVNTKNSVSSYSKKFYLNLMGAPISNSTQLNSGFPVYKIANTNFFHLSYVAKICQTYVKLTSCKINSKLTYETKTKVTS